LADTAHSSPDTAEAAGRMPDEMAVAPSLSPLPAPESLSRQAGVIILGRGLAFFFSFVVPVVLVRTITKESYGIYREAIFIFSTFMPILQFGLTQSLFYFFPRRPAERGILVTQTLLLLSALGLLFAVGLIFARGWVAAYFDQPAMADFAYWIGPYTALMVVSSTIEVLTIVEQNAALTFWVIMGSEGLRALLVVAVAVLTRDVGMMLVALTVFSAARTLFVIVHCRAERLLKFAAMSRDFLREQLAYAVPFGLAGTVVTIVSSVDRFYVSRFFSSEQFAVYSVGCFQLPVVTIVFQSATSVILGRMAELQKENRLAEMLALWRSAIRKMALVAIPVTVVFAVLAREFIVGLFTDEYREATPIFIAFLALIPRQAIPYGAVTRAFGLTRYILWVCLIALGVGVVLAFLLARPLGLLGPALAVIAGMWVVAGMQVARTRKLLQVSWGRLFPWSELAKMTVLAVVLGLVLIFTCRNIGGPPIAVLSVGSALYLAAYVALGARLRLIQREEFSEALALLRRLGGRR
jgi:O-antigen/teichoic acid export membrane protein